MIIDYMTAYDEKGFDINSESFKFQLTLFGQIFLLLETIRNCSKSAF